MTIPRRQFLHNSLGTAATVAAAMALHPHSSLGAEDRKRIRVGQLGTAIGGHAGATMETLRKLSDDYEVVGVVVEPDGGTSSHRAFNDVPRLTEEQLFNTPGLQLVAVEGAVDTLFPGAARAVAAGKHVHIEKPGSIAHGIFETLLRDADERKLIVQVGYFLRHHPALQFLYQAVREGWLGKIFEIHGVMSKVIPSADRPAFAAERRVPMFELGCYLIDTTVGMMQRPDKVTPFSRRTRGPSDDFIDNQVAVLEYPECTATIRATFVDINGFDRRQIVVCGEEGQIEIRPLETSPRIRLTLTKPHGDYPAGTRSFSPGSPKGRLDDYFRDLARTIRGEQETPFNNLHNLSVHEALVQASDLPRE